MTLMLLRVVNFANFIIWLAINCFPLIISVNIKNILDNLQLKEDIQHTILCFVLILAVLIQCGCIILGGKIDTISRFDIRKLLRKNIICNALLNRRSKKDIGKLIKVITTDMCTIEELVFVEIDLLCKLLFAVESFFILLTINVKITILVLMPILIANYFIYRFGENINKNHKDARSSSINYSAFIHDIVSGRETVQLLGETKNVLKYMDKLSLKRKEQTIRQEIFNIIMSEFSDISAILSVLLLLLVASFEIIRG